jgi:hypothetical protein
MHDFEFASVGTNSFADEHHTAKRRKTLHPACSAARAAIEGAQAHQNISDNKLGTTKSRCFFSCWSVALILDKDTNETACL